MGFARNIEVAARFAARADRYDQHATLQAGIAHRLSRFLPQLEAPDVLEIGCGTGLLTRRLISAYPDGRFLVTDLAAPMLAVCRKRVAPKEGQSICFAVMDGEAPDVTGRFDLIATSMTLQWLEDPVRALERLQACLRPGGHLLFATLGADGFPEWRAALAAERLPDGLVRVPQLPGVMHEERPTTEFDNALAFLERLKAIGAGQPRPGYRPLPPGALRAALRRLDAEHGARVTWHVVYGHLRS